MKVILLAGGSGSRLWPYSKESTPKQVLHLFMKFTPLQTTLKRFAHQIPEQDLFIVTNGTCLELIKEQAREILPLIDDQFIIEPSSKNTAPAIAWAIKHLLSSHQIKVDNSILIIPIDHVFSDDEQFFKIVKNAEHLAEHGNIVIFGVKPLRADEGFGYIQMKEPLTTNGYSVKAFVEKPSLELAERYIESHDWFWNTGIFLFTPKTILEHFKQFSQEIYNFLCAEDAHEDYIFNSLIPISIDHAIIEKSSKLRLVSLDPVRWLDIGSWDNLYEILEKDDYQNVVIGNVIQKNCNNCLLISENKKLSVTNLDHMIIIETNEGAYVSKRKYSQKIKDRAEQLKKPSNLLPV